MNNKIQNLEDKISKDIFDLDNLDQKEIKAIKDISERITKIKRNFSKTTGNNIIEFLTKAEYDKNKSNNNSKKSESANKNIMSLLSDQKWDGLFSLEQERIQRYNDYRIIYSYITDLALCIDSYTDMIISPDELIDSSMNINYKGNSIFSNQNIDNQVYDNVKKLLYKYKLTKKQKTIVRDTLKLGDQFVAVLRYDKEFENLILKENNRKIMPNNNDDDILTESFLSNEEWELLKEALDGHENFETSTNKSKKNNASNFYSEIQKGITNSINNIGVKSLTQFVKSNNSDLAKKKMKRVNGNIIKILKPENVVKLELDGMNFGYIYSEKEIQNIQADNNKALADVFNSRTDLESDRQINSREKIITDIFTKGIGKKLNLDFLEKNDNFKDFVYILLKNKDIFNSKINFTYIPPENMEHFYVDENEIYGTSKMAKSLFLAKLYLSSMITQQMEKISRGRDKRVIYVETGIDDDIEGSIQQVVRDIKSKEIQSDVLGDLTTILNTLGIFDDYYIPLIDGEKPIEIDTIQGMDTNSDEEWLNFLLRGIIKGTGFPANYIDSINEVDFAKTVVMQNALFVRSLVSDQQDFEEQFTSFIRKLYINEYSDGSNDEIINSQAEEIFVSFPRPKALNLTNINDQISNATQTIEFLTNTYIDEQDQAPDNNKLKVEFKKNVAKEILPSIDWNKIDKIFEKTKIDVKEKKLEDATNKSETADDGMGSMDDGMEGY